MARPSLLTDDLRETIERDLAEGVPVKIAAASAGIGVRTLHSWLTEGRVARRPTLRLVTDESSEAPADEREVERALVAACMRAAQHDWRAAAFLLTWRERRRRRPKR